VGNTAFNFWYKTPGVPFEETYPVHPRLAAAACVAAGEVRSLLCYATRPSRVGAETDSEQGASASGARTKVSTQSRNVPQSLKDSRTLTASPAVQRTPEFFATVPQTIRVSWQAEHWPAGPTDLALGHAPDKMVRLHQGVAAQVDSIKTCVEIATGFSA